MSKFTKTGLEDTVLKLDEKLDLVTEKLISIDKTLERNTDNLEEHMKRSDALESMIQNQEVKFHSELEPIKKHINMLKGGLKLFALISAFAALILTIINITESL